MHERKYCKTIFLNGLKDEVRAELTLHSVDTLSQMMDMAELIDSKNKVFFKGGLGGRTMGRDSSFVQVLGFFLMLEVQLGIIVGRVVWPAPMESQQLLALGVIKFLNQGEVRGLGQMVRDLDHFLMSNIRKRRPRDCVSRVMRNLHLNTFARINTTAIW